LAAARKDSAELDPQTAGGQVASDPPIRSVISNGTGLLVFLAWVKPRSQFDHHATRRTSAHENCSKLQLAATNKINAVGGRKEVYSEGVSKEAG
jgi:hypothetical protein